MRGLLIGEKKQFIAREPFITRNYSGGIIKVNDETLIMMVHEVAPPEYSPVLSSLETAKGNGITLDDIQVAMHTHWRYLSAQQKKTREKVQEIMLAATQTPFYGLCYLCNQQGHHANNCPNRHRDTKHGDRHNMNKDEEKGSKQGNVNYKQSRRYQG